ncbi:MAG: thiol-activated cytolysin family protein [Prevotellaceae bacterium]|jgi:thiol-activated cytolysin|nr:thiol-activated cytolysin family protein [Prevotellaceae bacterium]
MKILSKIQLTALLAAAMTFAASCSKDSAEDVLKPVRFENAPQGEISALATGATKQDPVTDQILKEYVVTYEKSSMFDEADLIKGDGIGRNLLYPASILRGSSFMQGQYDPLVLTNKFKPVTIFIDIKGITTGKVYEENVYPGNSDINQAVNHLLNQNGGHIPSSYIRTNYTYECDSVSTSESFKETINIHTKANVPGIVGAEFYYEDSQAATGDEKYVLVKLKQYVYTVGIDPFYKWVEGGLMASECGEYEPVYISSVNYGRVAYLLIQTKATTAETRKMVNASIDLLVGGIGGSANVAYNNEFKRLFNEDKIKVSIQGGPAMVITGYDSFINHMKEMDFLTIISRPISFTVTRLKDNTQVEMVNYYTDIVKEYRP